MRVLVTGGAGYVGSVVAEILIARGHTVTVYDDLSTGHRDAVPDGARLVVGTLADAPALGAALAGSRAEAVVHMAARALVGESVTEPAAYYATNVEGGLILLGAMRAAGVRRLVFSSSAAIYGEPATTPIEEDSPAAPTNPYGETKLAFERALGWFDRAYGLRSVSLRYFNAAGATERRGERHDPETHLIPLVLAAAAGRRPAVTIHGEDYPTPDGTCVRDYVHVGDLAEAHALALAALADGAGTTAYNLGCGGAGASVREVIAAAGRATGRAIPVVHGPRRAGDPSVLVAASSRIRRELGWRPRQAALDAIVASAWRWMLGPGRPR
jgi:UDP-glucose 4-epimerase